MVLVGARGDGAADKAGGDVAGNFFFFGNCICASCYVVRSKPLLRRFPPVAVTAWSYCAAAILMLFTTLSLSPWPTVVSALCPDCRGAWRVPRKAAPALAYWVLCQSCLAYSAAERGRSSSPRAYRGRLHTSPDGRHVYRP